MALASSIRTSSWQNAWGVSRAFDESGWSSLWFFFHFNSRVVGISGLLVSGVQRGDSTLAHISQGSSRQVHSPESAFLKQKNFRTAGAYQPDWKDLAESRGAAARSAPGSLCFRVTAAPPNAAWRVSFRGAKDKYERKSYKCFWKQCFRKTNWRIFLWFRDSKDFPDKTNNWKAQTMKEIITTLHCIQGRTDFPLPVRAGYFS